MVPGGPWPAARSLSQELQEILQRAASGKQQATSHKLATIGKYNKK
jgi:hypothetical protein